MCRLAIRRPHEGRPGRRLGTPRSQLLYPGFKRLGEASGRVFWASKSGPFSSDSPLLRRDSGTQILSLADLRGCVSRDAVQSLLLLILHCFSIESAHSLEELFGGSEGQTS